MTTLQDITLHMSFADGVVVEKWYYYYGLSKLYKLISDSEDAKLKALIEEIFMKETNKDCLEQAVAVYNRLMGKAVA